MTYAEKMFAFIETHLDEGRTVRATNHRPREMSSRIQKGDRVVARDRHHGRRRAIVEEPWSGGGAPVLGPVFKIRYENGWADWKPEDELEKE